MPEQWESTLDHVSVVPSAGPEPTTWESTQDHAGSHPGFLDELYNSFKTFGKSVGAGYYASSAESARLLANAADLVDKATGGAEKKTEELWGSHFRNLQQYYSEKAKELDEPGIPAQIAKGLGEVPGTIARYVMASSVGGGPVAGMAAVGALSEADKGIVPAIGGAVQGGATGAALRVMAPATPVARMAGGATLFGGQALASGASLPEVVSGAVTGAALMAPGGPGTKLNIPEGLRRGVAHPLELNPVVAAVKALNPTPREERFSDHVESALADIKAASPVLTKSGKIPSNESIIKVAPLAISKAQGVLERKWMDPARRAGVRFSGDPIVKATIDAIPETMWAENPVEAQAIVDRTVRAYGGKRFLVDPYRRFLKEKNAELDSFYDKDTGKQQASVISGSPQAVVKAQRDAIADTFYRSLDTQNEGAGPREIQQRTGTMIDILDAAKRRRNAIIKEKPVTPIAGAAKAAYSVVNIPGSFLKGETEKPLHGIRTAFSGESDPLIRRAFDAVGEPNPYPVPGEQQLEGRRLLGPPGTIYTGPPGTSTGQATSQMPGIPPDQIQVAPPDTSSVRGVPAAPWTVGERQMLPAPSTVPGELRGDTPASWIVGKRKLLSAPEPGQPPMNVLPRGPGSANAPSYLPMDRTSGLPMPGVVEPPTTLGALMQQEETPLMPRPVAQPPAMPPPPPEAPSIPQVERAPVAPPTVAKSATVEPTPTPVEPPPAAAEPSALDAGSIIKPDEAAKAARPSGAPPEGTTVLEPRRPGNPFWVGKAVEVRIPGENRSFAARYVVRELDDVHASHNAYNFEKNPSYQHRNDRNYSDPKNAERIDRQAREFDPAYLVTDAPDAVNGPPIIDSNGNVYGGNSRTMTLDRVYKEDSQQGKGYRAALESMADRFGLDPKDIAGMKSPVLVREMTEEVKPGEAQRIISDLNKTGTAALTPAERAIADSRRLSQDTLEYLQGKIEAEGPEGTMAQALEGPSGSQIVNRLVDDGIITPQEKPQFTDERGVLTAAAKQRISRLMVGRLFRDSSHFENTPPELRNKLERTVAPLARLSGRPEWNLLQDVQGAVDLLQEARAHGVKNLTDIERQKGLFGEAPRYSPQTLAIAKKLQEGPRKVAAAFNEYAGDEVLSRPGAPTTFFEAPSQSQAFDNAFGKSPEKQPAPIGPISYYRPPMTLGDLMQRRLSA